MLDRNSTPADKEPVDNHEAKTEEEYQSINARRNIIGEYNGKKCIVDPNGNPFRCVIYEYTTGEYRKNGWTKVGSARRAAPSAYEAAMIRIKEQETAKNAVDPIIILKVIDVTPDCADTDTYDYHVEFSKLRTLEQTWLHAEMSKMGFWVPTESKSSEWFYNPKTKDVQDIVDTVDSLINQYRVGVYRPNVFPMRPEQKECAEQIMQQFKAGSKQFLLNGKPRYGKTHTTYSTVKLMREWLGRPIKVLVVTAKPTVHRSWQEDCDRHVDFEEFKYYSTKDEKDKTKVVKLPGKDSVEILFTSFQDLNKHEDKPKWRKMTKEHHFDLIVIDECHYGSSTDLATKTLAAMSHDRILFTSGTPIKMLMSGAFSAKDIYTWSYIDEQRKKREERRSGWLTEHYRWLPQLELRLFHVCDEAKQQLQYYETDEGFNYAKLFATDNHGKFLDPASVKMFIDQYIGQLGDKKSSPFRMFAADHQLWFVNNSINSAKALVRMLKDMLKGQYEIILAAGNGQGTITNIDGVKNKIKQHEKTITISCGRFNTGATVPEWDVIAMLNDTSSIETYLQSIFRCQTPDKERGKEKCYVVDFCPTRTLNAIFEYAAYVRKEEQSITECVREFLDFAPVMDHNGNTVKPVNVTDVINSIPMDNLSVKRFGHDSNLNRGALVDVMGVFEAMDRVPTDKIEYQIGVGKDEIPKGKSYKTKNRAKGQTDEEAKREREAWAKAKNTSQKIPGYLLVEQDKMFTGIHDIAENADPDLFKEMVDIDLEDLKYLLDKQFYNVKNIDTSIMSFYLAMDEE